MPSNMCSDNHEVYLGGGGGGEGGRRETGASKRECVKVDKINREQKVLMARGRGQGEVMVTR